MGTNYKTIADFEVATAAEAQVFMDQGVQYVDTSDDLATLPTVVKTAYVKNTGVFMTRNISNNWVPGGGAAFVSETAPSDPQTGALWFKPSEVLPKPLRVNITGGSGTVTAVSPTYAQIPSSTTVAFTTPKAVMVVVSFSSQLLVSNTANTSTQARVSWTGAMTGDSFNQAGQTGLVYQWAPANVQTLNNVTMTFTMAVAAGTTTFKADAYKNAASGTVQYTSPWLSITPVAWADAYDAGVS